MPGIQIKEFFHQDGTRFIAISRGSWAWMKLKPEEIPALCNDLMDTYEKEQK